ncbi:antitoxin [Pedobacter mendelii]|uniref:Antitoxin n=1 Tax=Pedobacter mendelii TaxID=1908240 RepID=A0ABQ2BEN6_9SPHI|nr:antitoxin [Pedobacter mendelii]
MLASNHELIKHMLDEINFILEQSSSKSKEEVTTDPVLSRAIIRSLEIIGEASSKIDDEFRSKYPYIE